MVKSNRADTSIFSRRPFINQRALITVPSVALHPSMPRNASTFQQAAAEVFFFLMASVQQAEEDEGERRPLRYAETAVEHIRSADP